MKKSAFILLAICGFAVGGCMSSALLNQSSSIFPSPNPHLALYDTSHGILAEYDAVSERTGSVTRRAYLVELNWRRLDRGKKPVFIDPKSVINVPQIPILPAKPTVPPFPAVYGTVDTNKTTFTVIRGNMAMGPCDLPTYSDGWVTAGKVAFLPLAAVGDATIIGGAVGAVVGTYYVAGRTGGTVGWSDMTNDLSHPLGYKPSP